MFHLCLGMVGLTCSFLGRKIQLGNLMARRRPSVSSVFGNGLFDLILSWQEDPAWQPDSWAEAKCFICVWEWLV